MKTFVLLCCIGECEFGVGHYAALAMTTVTTTLGYCLCFPSGRVDHFGRAIHKKGNKQSSADKSRD